MTQPVKERTVLLLIETLNRGGIETVLLRLIPKLKKEGWSSIVLTIRDGGEMVDEYRRAGIKVVPLSQRYFLSPSTIRVIRQQIATINPDLVMTTLSKADVIGRLFLRFSVRQPVVSYLVTTYNHPRYWIARVFERFTKSLTNHYIANSEAVQKFYQERLGVKPGRIVVAPNGVDTSTFQDASTISIIKELKLPNNAFVITCVANLAPNKGQADLLAAFETVFVDQPNVYLLLVGDGEQREALKAQRQTLRTKKRIVIMGRRTDVPAILKATTVFALPTLFEGMSTALLEAMAAAKAIVTTDIPENKVLLTHKETALLVKPQDRVGLANALEKMYRDPALRDRLRQEAFAQVEARYSISKMAQIFGQIFADIAGLPIEQNGFRRKVVHIINSLESGGAENMLLRTLPILSNNDLEHIVITLFRPGELAPAFKRAGIKLVNVGAKSIFDLVALRRLAKQVASYQPALVITYLFHAGLIGRLYIQRRVKTPVIPFLRTTYNFPRYAPARLFEWLTKGLVGHYFANSTAVKNYYVDHLGVGKEKITVLHNGIDTALYQQAEGQSVVGELRLPAKRTVVTCVANLAVNKGHTYLLEAFEQVAQNRPDTFLLIVGEGPERANLESQAKNLTSGLRVKFLGRRSDVPEILAITDIFVLPTMFEGLSNAIIEAMAAGTAVITTDIPENRELITDQQTGLLIPAKQSKPIEQAINQLLANPDDRRHLGLSAQKYIKQNFDLQRVALEFDKAIRDHAQT